MANKYEGESDLHVGGKKRVLRYPLRSLAALGQTLDMPIDELVAADLRSFNILEAFLWAGLIHKEPDLTLEEVGSWYVTFSKVLRPIQKAFHFGIFGAEEPDRANPPKPKAKSSTGTKSGGGPSGKSASRRKSSGK